MNNTFKKYLRIKNQDEVSEKLIEEALNELHKTFATLTQEEQKFAEIFMRDVDKGDVIPDENETLRDYITEYMKKAYDDQIHQFATTFGLNEKGLRLMISYGLDETNIDEFGRYTNLKSGVDKAKAKKYFEEKEGVSLIPPKVNQKMDKLLRNFIISGGFEL